MDNTENNKNTKPQSEKTTKGTRESSTLSKLGIFSLALVGISLVLALIVLAIKVWRFFIAKVEQVGEGTFFGDHIVLVVALMIIVDIVALVLYILRKKD